MTLPPSDGLQDDNRNDAARELAVRVMVSGTTVMGIYEVKDATVLLASADFGDASAALDCIAPKVVAARRLQEIAETEMARSGVHYIRDDETDHPPLRWTRVTAYAAAASCSLLAGVM